jgi:endonuclease/exonuclease/phosphatase family metal-dependent hydrolase
MTKTFLPLVSAGQQRQRKSVCARKTLQATQINVATYNIGASDKWLASTSAERIQRIMQQVDEQRDVEVVAFQEVLQRLPLRAEVAALKELYPKWSMFVAPHNERQDYMNAIMSCHPIVIGSERTRVIESRKGYAARTNISVQVLHPACTFRAYNVHTRFDEAEHGVRQTMEWVLDVSKDEPSLPYVVMGDFNSAHSDTLASAAAVGIDLTSLRASRIDHVLASGLRIDEACEVQRPVVEGEHNPVYATLRKSA